MQVAGSGMQQLVEYYQYFGTWDGVDDLLSGGVYVNGPAGMGMPQFVDGGFQSSMHAGPLDVLLADARGKVVYDSAGRAVGKSLSSEERTKAVAITPDGSEEVIGYLLLSLPSAGGEDRLGNLEKEFLARVQKVLWIGAALAVGLGLIMGVILSRSLTAPLQRLAAAARAVAGGNLDQRVKLEGSAEMAEVGQSFNEMTSALKKAEVLRQNLVADVAHELRTPLSVLQGNLRAILDDVYDLDKTEISRLYDETRLLSRLVDDLRELALADAGQLHLNLRPTDAAQVIRSTTDSLALAVEAGQVVLTTTIPDSLPTVQADPDRMAQVLRNLLVNALRHTPAGGSVTVTASTAGRALEIAVADTGEGIAAEDLPHVFERFWRADPSRARDDRLAGGTGLGLSVAQSLVEAQGGRIWAESALGEGTIFRFTLPLV
jgi:two-component system OmpR family sensor kinase/two-component system sensor histidine kinase BaeS